MQFKNIIIFIFSFSCFSIFSQVKVGQWLDHLSYDYANSVAKVGSLVYASNGSGLVKFNENDNSIEKLTKIEGLSDVGIKLLRKNEFNDVLMVIYNNNNIDIINSDQSILNVSDLKRKIITGNKTINEVYFKGNLAYLACGFGIIVFDTKKMEIKDTYYLGSAVFNLEVYQVTQNDSAIFAATPTGIYYGKLNTNLSNFQNWKSLNIGIAPGPYNAIVNFNGKIITNYSARLKSNVSFKDTLYEYTLAGWQKYATNGNYINSENKKLFDYSQYGKLLILDQFGIADYDASGTKITWLTNYGFDYANINDCYYDNNINFWAADNFHGLIKSGGSQYTPNIKITINGPNTKLINDLDCKDGSLYTAATYLGDEWNNQYDKGFINTFKDRDWKSFYSAILDTIGDINCVAVDPNDKNHVIYGSWGKGIIEMKNDQISKVYNTSNSSLTAAAGSARDARIGGVCFDSNSNIWAVASLNNKFLNLIKKNGTSLSFDFTSIASVNTAATMPINPNATKIIVDKNNTAWIILSRGNGMVAYNPGTTFTQPNTSNAKVISSAVGSGALPSLDVRSMVEDKDGKIWIGTTEGVAVFYNPENIFNGGKWDAQQILIEQDNHVQILLQNDVISSITIDGVNRKWIGTESSGVYCLSADGQKQIYHFTTETSPLYSNIIRDIVVDENSGDVFIASQNGIQSFRTSIIKGFENYTNVHCYPNPIKPGSNSYVYVTGLIDESIVKITDIAGNLVWQAKSQGGQIEWNMQTLSNAKATTGTYIVYCANANGEQYATTKLLIVN